MVPLAQRIGEFNRSAHFRRLHAEIRQERDFQLKGFPRVRLTDAFDAPSAETTGLRLEFADTTRIIPVRKPPVLNLPTLAGYEEWAKVLAINEVEINPDGRSAGKLGSERLLIVVRRTPEGVNPETWGTVRRDDWLFDVYELRPDATIATTRWRWPRDGTGYKSLAETNLQERASKSTDAALKAFAALPPLTPRSVEMFASMHVIPKLSVPSYKFDDTALSPRVLGWTLPTSALSGLVLSVSVFFAFAPGRRRVTA